MIAASSMGLAAMDYTLNRIGDSISIEPLSDNHQASAGFLFAVHGNNLVRNFHYHSNKKFMQQGQFKVSVNTGYSSSKFITTINIFDGI